MRSTGAGVKPGRRRGFLLDAKRLLDLALTALHSHACGVFVCLTHKPVSRIGETPQFLCDFGI